MSMIKRYLENVKQRSAHERRGFALRVATSITGVIFVGWLATLGVRLASPHPKTAAEITGFKSEMASVISAFGVQAKKAATLEVASTTNQY